MGSQRVAHDWVTELNWNTWYMRVQSLSCLTLWNPMDCSLLGSSGHGISQARTLEWIAISFSKIHTNIFLIFLLCCIISLSLIFCWLSVQPRIWDQLRLLQELVWGLLYLSTTLKMTCWHACGPESDHSYRSRFYLHWNITKGTKQNITLTSKVFLSVAV